jgi:hypothetical protein
VDDMSETARAHILKVMENLAAVEEWRAKQPDPDDLNHPSRVCRSFSDLPPRPTNAPNNCASSAERTQGLGRPRA